MILGQSKTGQKLNSQAQIIDILNYAIHHHAPLQIGNITVDTEFPLDEIKDMSCAEALLKVLRWAPDSVTFFDYGTAPYPTLHILKRSDLAQYQFNLQDPQGCPLKKIHLSPRHDLVAPAVVLKYEKSQIYNGESWAKTFVDKYPEQATGKEFKSIVLTIELEGEKSQSVLQKVKTQFINPESSDWWKGHLPALSGIPADKIKIENIRRTSELPNELMEGSIAPWMNKEIEEDIIQAQVSYESEHEIVIQREFAIKLHATNASSKTYFKSISSTNKDILPQGLAKALYENLSILHYEGEIEVSLDPEKHLNLKLIGSTINIEGGKKNWTTMNALVQEVQEYIDSGFVKIKVGPAKHLGIDDMIEVLKTNRNRNATTRAGTRLNGLMHSIGKVSMPTHSRIESTHQGPGQYKKMVFIDPESPKRKIILNAGDILNEVTVQLREEHVCHNGQLMRRLVLASEPFLQST